MNIDEAIKLCEKCISGDATYDEVTQYFDEIETPERIVALLRFVQAVDNAWADWAKHEEVVQARDAVDEALK